MFKNKTVFYCKVFIRKILMDKGVFNIPLYKRILVNSRGFTADQLVRYNLMNNFNEYISELERWKTREINGQYNYVLDNKLIFEEVFSKHLRIPKNYAWISNGKIRFLKREMEVDDLDTLLKKEKALVLKPVILAGGGKGVCVIKYLNEKYFIDHKEVDFSEIISFVQKLDDYIAVEFIKQHNYINQVFDKTTNTIRIVTMQCNETNDYTIPLAVHRIGVNESIPVDNAKKGALVSEIDINTGRLGLAKTYYSTKIYSNHPDTGVRIEGCIVPYWDQIKEQLIKVARRFPYIKFIAWDVVVTKDGFVIIEGNASTGLDLFQMWSGQRNKELGVFYQKQGVIK